ncbi:MAG: conserved membrane protein of unknown function [Nitrospira sp.]
MIVASQLPSRSPRGSRRRGRRVVSALVVMAVATAACAGPQPLLRANAKYQLQGREGAKLDIAECQQKAEAAGLDPGTEARSGNVAAGAGLGLIVGAAVGATSGIAGGPAGIAIGAAAGAGLGLIIGSLGGAYRPLEPSPPYADAVVHCLIEKGYEVKGWE